MHRLVGNGALAALAIGCALIACNSQDSADKVAVRQAELASPYCIGQLLELADFATAYRSSVLRAQTDCATPSSAECQTQLDAMVVAQTELEAAQNRFFSACPEEHVCTPNANVCLDGRTRATCNSAGTGYDSQQVCTNTCLEGTCTGACQPNQTLCSGNNLQRCGADGTWTTETLCANGCTNGACLDCAPNTSQCVNGTTLRRCQGNGTWGPSVVCSNQACIAGACVGVCQPGQLQCSGTTLNRCDANGTWALQQQCTNQACVSGACMGVCAPGQRRCAGGRLETCSSTGTWVSTACRFNICTNSRCTWGAQ